MSSNRSKQTAIGEDLERRILHGLACEWQEAVSILDSPQRNLMRMPLFCLDNMKNRLGEWSSEKRQIRLSRSLVLEHSWASVVEVLVHEIAHQFADEVLGVGYEPPHGPMFKYACHVLRANPRASGRYQPLDDRIIRGSASNQDTIILRVKKLMALAQSRNKHEAEAAAAKAHELIAKHNVDLLARRESRDFVSTFAGRPALRHSREDYALAVLLTDFYFVRGIWVPAYVVDKGRMGRALEITGTAQNIEIAGYVYDFVRRSIDSQWDEYNGHRGLNRYRKTDFAVGVINGLAAKLKRQGQAGEKRGGFYPLVKLQDPLLKEYVAYRYPRVSNVAGRSLRHDSKVFNDGVKVGANLVVSKGVSDKNRGGVYRLEGG